MAEWHKRLQNMTPEEKQQYNGRLDNACFEPSAGMMLDRGSQKEVVSEGNLGDSGKGRCGVR